jgi:peptidylprolyl isomerase
MLTAMASLALAPVSVTIRAVKSTVLFSFLCLIFALASCGGSSDSTPPPDEVVWRKTGPEVIVHHGPIPEKLIVEDVRKGTGAVLKKGSVGTFKYKDFDYRTGEQYEDWWANPFRTPFGEGDSLGAWETGLKGMRVGGRRILIVPPAQAYTHVPVIYAIELAAVE